APAALTTPDAIEMHRWLAAQRADRARCAALEASSHALDQGRLDGVRVRVGVFTNLTPEHLDYHQTMAAYGAAKARLFHRPELEHAVLFADDPFAAQILRSLPPHVRPICVTADPARQYPGARHLVGTPRGRVGAGSRVEFDWGGQR